MNTTKKFFAAANGYSGFRSYFDSVFKSEDYDKIYVLKGGPGTGKSSLMKKLSANLEEKEVKQERIYCSSDPDSLDGVIFEKDGKRAAILDGTAPHERDAKIPGAIDEIIDLGRHWEKPWLIKQKSEILELNKEKKNAYKTAYSYLKIAGAANKQAVDFYKSSCDSKLLNMLIKSLAEQNCGTSFPRITTRLVTSFGKRGEVKFDTLERDDYNRFSIIGNKESAYLFLNKLYENQSLNHSHIIRFPSPLDDSKTEALLFPDESIVYMIGGNGEQISTDDFSSISKLDAERIKAMERIENDALKEAERWFAIASEMHFRLEEIYSRSMDFSKNDLTLEKITAELYELVDV